MLIQNYGLFWRREHVFWGRGRNAGHLRGVLASARTANPVDFRNQQGIYCLYDDNFRMVYVGQSGSRDKSRLFSRLKKHRKDSLSDRWTKFSWFGVRGVRQDGELRVENIAAHPRLRNVLDHIEAVLIAAAEPPHNRQGGRFGENVQRYLQYRDKENLDLDATEMIRELWRESQGR